ncbi:MAG: restriction endonuclease subunit S, partial [Lachnospiraceae bacterium]|nr:restriction endonuclease subunit S [Lachnospiraceae bacterium]
IRTMDSAVWSMQDRFGKVINYLRSFQEFIVDKYSLLDSRAEVFYRVIRNKDLDGVIDAKRYLKTKKVGSQQLSDICDIIEEKTNVTKYGNQTIDWIRIDDLPNNPIDIETVRTTAASAMEGSFFEVKKDDILVARLGPTILNRKIVLVRTIDHPTLASAEFLVLRCKAGYNPEAVMAILKTEYYRDLMYSHSRGSTPSRYRLNREDALKLPFPDIKESQDQIAQEALRVRDEVLKLRKEAIDEWIAAKANFEKELLGE